MEKFKVGDKVKYTRVNYGKITAGTMGKIIVIGNNNPKYGVEFDENITGHSCAGNGKNGYCWYVFEEDIEKTEEKNIEFKEGVGYICRTKEQVKKIVKELKNQGYSTVDNSFNLLKETILDWICDKKTPYIHIKYDKDTNYGTKEVCGYDFVSDFIEPEEWFGNSCTIPSECTIKPENPVTDKIIILSDGKTTTSEYFKNNISIETGITKRNPKDEINFKIGAENALDRIFEEKFVQHLKSVSGYNYGNIGNGTPLKDIIGQLLKVGDTVVVYKGTNRVGERSVVQPDNYECFVMGLRGEVFDEESSYKIVKYRDCSEIKNGETVNYVRYIKEKE